MPLKSRQQWQSITSLLAMLAIASAATGQQRFSGFSAGASKTQAEIETKFKAIPSPDEA
jgi:hypothetical protein